jgi:hypothetical protein
MKNAWFIVATAVVIASAVGLVLTSGWFDSGPACGDGFDKGDWKRNPKDTGQAIAECDWFDGETKPAVIRALGKPDEAHRGWHTWEIGDSRQGIGPAAWFLLIRVQDGVVTRSEAEVQPV